jgi:putative ABC transport system substrate-binding protein
MRRREVIAALLIPAAVSTPARTQGLQSGAVPRLGYIWIGAQGSERSTLDGLRLGLRELGHVEGRDFALVDRYADLNPAALPVLVADLVALNVKAILAPGNLVIEAARRGTSAVPIIATAPDLLASGFVASLARPGGNVTGVSLTAGDALSEKWLEFVKELAPRVAHVAMLANPKSAASMAFVQKVTSAATKLGVELSLFEAHNGEELHGALERIAESGAGALIVESDPLLVSNRARIISFAAKHGLPGVYGNYEYTADGGLLSYASNIFEIWRRLASYVDRVLKGSDPAELPVEQAVSFQLRINLKTANALGLTIPPTLLARADEVIE